MSLTIRAGVTDTTQYTKETKRDGKTVFAGDLGIGKNDTKSMVSIKKDRAQRQALKMIGDAWDKDIKASRDADKMNEARTSKLADIKELQKKISDVEDQKAQVQKDYGVASDSQEQKDLELLEKFQNYKGGATTEEFTQEEIERLGQLQYIPRTEYQNKVLALNNVSAQLNVMADKKNREIEGIAQTLSNASINQEQNQDMMKAQDTADKIKDAANKEAFGMLVQEGIDHINDNMEDIKEKAEEKEEKEEEQQERIDAAKEDRKEQEEILEDTAEADKIDLNAELNKKSTDNVEKAQKNIEAIIKKNNLIEEDLKGIKIDFNF